MLVKDKKIYILGNGKSGRAIYDFLKEDNDVYICDEKDSRDEKNEYQLIISEFINIDFSGVDIVVFSPGIASDHDVFAKLKQMNIPYYGEVEFSYNFNKGDIIAVTGTNGKTTVVNAISFVLNYIGVENFLCGNVGIPFIKVANNSALKVLELSSYQIETLENFKANINVFLNLTLDHQERHKSMENYYNIKASLLKNSTEKDICIYNYSDEYFRNLERDFSYKAKSVKFNDNKETGSVFYNKESAEVILNVSEKESEVLFRADDLLIKGEHNVENMMAVFLALKEYGLPKEKIIEGILKFEGVEHRLEYMGLYVNRRVYNDSKSTNPESSMSAINAFKGENINIILGGSTKDVSYVKLGELIKKFNVNVFVQGETAVDIISDFKKIGLTEVNHCSDFDDAVNKAFENSELGSIILLSPACASFDKFANFEERGRYFKDYVRRNY